MAKYFSLQQILWTSSQNNIFRQPGRTKLHKKENKNEILPSWNVNKKALVSVKIT